MCISENSLERGTNNNLRLKAHRLCSARLEPCPDQTMLNFTLRDCECVLKYTNGVSTTEKDCRNPIQGFGKEIILNLVPYLLFFFLSLFLSQSSGGPPKEISSGLQLSVLVSLHNPPNLPYCFSASKHQPVENMYFCICVIDCTGPYLSGWYLLKASTSSTCML